MRQREISGRALTRIRLLKRLIRYGALGLATSIAIAWLLAIAPITRSLTPNAPSSYRAVFDPSRTYLIDSRVDLGMIRRDIRWNLPRNRWSEFGIEQNPVLGLEFGREAAPFSLYIGLAWAPLRHQSYGLASQVHEQSPFARLDRVVDDARGLPFLCLWHEIQATDEDPGRGVTPIYSTPGGIRLPSSKRFDCALTIRALPFRPIWSGLVLNTLWWGLMWWGAPIELRSYVRYRRLKRGLCPGCGYDVGASYVAPCPECGFLMRRAPRARDACPPQSVP
jgi:hypothetical protein